MNNPAKNPDRKIIGNRIENDPKILQNFHAMDGEKNVKQWLV